MNLSLESYKTFCLALLIKRVQKNSVWYQGESLNFFFKKLGLKMSYHTFKKYILILQKLKCFKKYGNHQQLLSWRYIAEKLNIKVSNKKGFYYLNQFLREESFEKFTFNKATDFVIKALIIFDFRYQNLEVNSNNYLKEASLRALNNQRMFNSRDYRMVQAVMDLAHKLGLSTEETALRLFENKEDHVKTGCYFLSEKFGLTHQKINILLNEMHNDRLLNREVITEDFKVDREISTRELYEITQGRPFFGYNGRYRIMVGSKITLPRKLKKVKISKVKRLPDYVEKIEDKEVFHMQWKVQTKSIWRITTPYKITSYQEQELK